jgi:23S rRNA (pseudouridine1915-N3)-methyltransferase
MGKSLKIEQVKPTRWDDHKKVIASDTQQIIVLLQKKYADYFKIYLSKDGRAMTTEHFADVLKKNLDVVFVIWWPYGLDEMILQTYINLKLNFWQMTLQHGLAKLVLLEQLYRVSTIWEGRQYHY